MVNFFKKKYNLKNNLIHFDIADQTVKKVINFYNNSPFPNYEDKDDKASINFKGEKNFIANEFKKFIGFNKNVLEVGCGTGQLSIYFGIGTNNKIFGLDAALESLNLGRDFIFKNKIENVKFVNADIFDDVFNENVFDFIWTNGVLHHTKNPKQAFSITSKYLKKDGYILVGLYNRYGRLRTIIRRFMHKIFGDFIVKILDPSIRNIKKGNKNQIIAWIRDQYEHPVERLHTFDEVLEWFEENNIQFINSIPSCSFDQNQNYNLFEKSSKGSFLYRLFSQVLMIFSNLGSDGGLFIMVGKKIK